MNKKTITKILFVAILGLFVYMGCSKDNSELSGSQESRQVYTNNNPETMYCLACHGGSYTALADSTEDIGENDWLNPHRSAHGTGAACGTCHETDETASQNTKCFDKTVMKSAVCATLCHEQHTLENPYYYPNRLDQFKPQTYLQ